MNKIRYIVYFTYNRKDDYTNNYYEVFYEENFSKENLKVVIEDLYGEDLKVISIDKIIKEQIITTEIEL